MEPPQDISALAGVRLSRPGLGELTVDQLDKCRQVTLSCTKGDTSWTAPFYTLDPIVSLQLLTQLFGGARSSHLHANQAVQPEVLSFNLPCG